MVLLTGDWSPQGLWAVGTTVSVHRQKIACMQFSFLSDHGRWQIASDLLTGPSTQTEYKINESNMLAVMILFC